MSFDTRVSGKRGDFVLSVAIQGIKTFFTEDPLVTNPSPTSGESWSSGLACIPVDGIKQGRQELDIEKRLVLGGDLTFTLREPNGSSVLRDLFQPRARRRTYLTANAGPDDTTLTVADNTWAPSSGTLYVGGETINYSAKISTTGFNCTRGKYRSERQIHVTATDVNSASSVFDVPPSFNGRKVYLFGAFLDDGRVFDAGTSAASRAKRKLLGVFYIEDPPRIIDGKSWEISCSPLMSQIINTKAYTGFHDATPTGLIEAIATTGEYKVFVDNADQFAAGIGGGAETHAIVGGDAGFFFAGERVSVGTQYAAGRITGTYVLTDPNYVIVKFEPGMFNPSLSFYLGSDPSSQTIKSIRHVASLPFPPAYSLLSILTSRKGDGDNGTYDVLPGEERGGGNDDAWQMGCGILDGLIDGASFQNVGNNTNGWSYILDETVSAGSILSEWCMVSDAFCCISDGLLTAKKMSDVRETSSLTIDDSNVAPSSGVLVEYTEEEVSPIMRVNCNYSPADSDFHLRASFIDHEMKERYPTRSGSRDYEFKGLSSGMPETGVDAARFVRPVGFEMTFTSFQNLVRTWQRATSRGRLVAHVKCGLPAVTLQIGSVVTLDLGDFPDLEGGTLSGNPARVIGAQPDWATGTVDLSLHIMETVFLVTPSDVVSAVSTVTLSNDTAAIAGGDSANYAVGMSIRLWDVSAGTSQVLTIAAVLTTPHRIQFTTSISGTVQTGEDWLTWNTNGTNSAMSPASGYTEADYSYQMIDSLAVTAGNVRRWR